MIILSLGAGVQSSTLALMAACGELNPLLPDCAIFSDTIEGVMYHAVMKLLILSDGVLKNETYK